MHSQATCWYQAHISNQVRRQELRQGGACRFARRLAPSCARLSNVKIVTNSRDSETQCILNDDGSMPCTLQCSESLHLLV